MSKNIDSIDPLEAKSSQNTTAAHAAIRREIENILCSYVGWFDTFSELIQNSLDSIDERRASEKKGSSYKPELRIIIDLKGNSLTVSDNGTGLSEEKYRQFLAPSFSFKSGKTRGHKGVGATFLAYGFNYIQIATKTPNFSFTGKMENARKWLSDPAPASNPLIVKDKFPAADAGFAQFDSGVSVTVRFDNSTTPGDLGWMKATTAAVWKDLLLLKTGLGSTTGKVPVKVAIIVRPKVGAEDKVELSEVEYLWPHLLVKKSKKLSEIQTKGAELYKKRGKDYRMPAAFRNLDCIYQSISAAELGKLLTLSADENSLVTKHTPAIYICYTHSARVWSDYNDSLNIRSGVEALKPGIQIAANSMPHGEVVQIPLKRNIGRQNQVHFVAHFDNCKADLGRKGFQKEIVSFCEEIAKRLIEGPFQNERHALRPATGAKTDLKRESDLDAWKDEMEQHEKSSPLELSNPNFFLPEQKISITSVPTREQDVIALFNQLIAGGVIRGIKIMSTNERFTYDGMYRVSFSPPKENHLYHAKTNPLGISGDNFHNDGFVTKPKILEYKLTLDGLMEDLESGDKNEKDMGLVVVWETGEQYLERYHILSLLDDDNLNERQYHGVTHVMQNYQTSTRVMDLIVLSELIQRLNDPQASAKAQKKKYDDPT